MSGSYVGLITERFQRGSPMTRSDQYRHLAEDVRTRASKESSPILKAEWENLAETYMRLAEQSEDRNIDPPYDPVWDILDRSRRH